MHKRQSVKFQPNQPAYSRMTSQKCSRKSSLELKYRSSAQQITTESLLNVGCTKKRKPRSIIQTSFPHSQKINPSKIKREYQRPNNKQNEIHNNLIKNILPNRDLIKTSLKPSKINFMNRVSNIYDLLIAKTPLPLFVEYFLGHAMYAVSRKMGEGGGYDWKLQEFKTLCESIYDRSEQEDLKHFMTLTLPTATKWNTRPSSTKHNTTVGLYTSQQSRVSQPVIINTRSNFYQTQGGHPFNNSPERRAQYFKSLSRKSKLFLGQQKKSVDIIQKLNQKLDGYLKKHYQSDYAKRQIKQALAERDSQTGPKWSVFRSIFHRKL